MPADTVEDRWRPLLRAGGLAALVIVALIPVQMAVFIACPPPETVAGFFALLEDNALLGLLSLDLLYLLNNALLSIVYLALYVALRRTAESAMAIALTLGLIGIAAYFASNTAFEMLSLAGQYGTATSDLQRTVMLAAGQAMLAIYQGTAFDVYYVLNAAALLVMAGVMLRSPLFSRRDAGVGLAAGVLMVIPSTAGTVGLIFAIASLVPWAVFSVLVARRLFKLARTAESGVAG
jgi:hypothetical protein